MGVTIFKFWLKLLPLARILQESRVVGGAFASQRVVLGSAPIGDQDNGKTEPFKNYILFLCTSVSANSICVLRGTMRYYGGPRDVMWHYKKEFYRVASSTMGYCRVLQNICMYRITYIQKSPSAHRPHPPPWSPPCPGETTGLGWDTGPQPSHPHGRGALGICFFDDLCNFNFLPFPHAFYLKVVRLLFLARTWCGFG